MKYKRIILLGVIFLSFLGLGSMVSNLQSYQADQLMETHGLSNNTRSFKINSTKSVKSFLQYLVKKFSDKKIQVHMDNSYDPEQVLIWANHEIANMPTENGRYFTQEDFSGQISLAILSKNVEVSTLKTQNNQYIILNNHYYSVIGTLKYYQRMKQNKYYLSTGVKQPTANSRLKNYRVVIDTSPKVIRRVAKFYHVHTTIPSFIKKRQKRQASVYYEWFYSLLFVVLILICNLLMALIDWQVKRKSKIYRSQLKTLFVERGGQVALIELLLAVVAYVFLRWRAFYSQPLVLFLGFLISWVLGMIAYELTSIYSQTRSNSK